MKITKEITFDCAHMLSNYDGKCNNLHGHTYKLQVVVEGVVNQETCMLIDFNKLKSIIQNAVMENFDHAVIFSEPIYRDEAEEALYEWAKKYHKKYFVIQNGKTTCECLAPSIQNSLQIIISPRFRVGIKLWETPTSFAEV